MAEQSELGQLVNLLSERLDRQEAQAQQTNALLAQVVDVQNGMLATQNDMLATQNRMQATQDRMQATQHQMLTTQSEMLTTQNEMLATQNQMLATQNQMLDRMTTIERVQIKMLDNHEQLLNYVVRFREQQEHHNARFETFMERQQRFNDRQEETDAILLDEIRELKLDVREIKKKLFGEIEERVRRLEDFMNDTLRKAS